MTAGGPSTRGPEQHSGSTATATSAVSGTSVGGTPPLAHACDPAPSGDVSGTPSSTTAPARSKSRLVGIDAARGIALVGMVAVHNIDARDADGTASLAWALSAGKSAALFALLAGVGLAFASGGRRRPTGRTWTGQAAALLTRGLIIGAVGLTLGYVVPRDYAGVILPYYGALFVLAIPLLSLSIRALVGLAAVIAVGMPVLSHLLRTGTDATPVGNLTFTDLFADPLQTVRDLALTGLYPALPWMAYLCVGLAVGQAVLSARRTVVAMTLIGAALVAASTTVSWLLLDVLGGRTRLEAVALQSMTRGELDAAMTSGWAGVTPTDTPWWLATMSPHSTTPFDLANTIGLALVVLGVCILLGRTTTALLRPLAAAGSMTLTLYCAHLLLLSWSVMPGDLAGFLIQTAVLVAFALVWSRTHARGPFEEIVAEAAGAVRRRVLAGGRTRAHSAARSDV